MNELFDDVSFKPFGIFEEYENLCEKVSPGKQYRDLYHSRHQILNSDQARQSPIEALRSEQGSPSPSGKGDEEDRLGKVTAGQNSTFDAGCGIALEHYAIVPTSWVEVPGLHIEHFAEGKLICVKEIGNYKNNLINFKKELLVIELKWVLSFLSVITKHLKNRNYQNESLLKLSHIKQIIAEIVTDYEMAKMLLIDEERPLNQASQLIISSCTKLMKLPGGRAFLKGSVLEMLWTFEALKNVYYHN